MNSSIEGFLKKHSAYPSVLKIIKKLVHSGYEAVLAGGAVRDALLNSPFHDFDVATSATPDQIELLFSKTLAVGKAFGVMVVIEDGIPIEVATFRRDGVYRDGRHPEKVEFSDLKEDAKRRDFTVNALFYDPVKHKILDFVGGVRDLQARTLRAVGEPRERFSEDRLRLLRTVRFAAQLGFQIEETTWKAVQELSAGVTQVSAERQLAELRRLALTGEAARGWLLMDQSGLFKSVLPQLAERAEQSPSIWIEVLNQLVQLNSSPPLHVQLAWFGFVLDRERARGLVGQLLKSLKSSLKESQEALLIIDGLYHLCEAKTADVLRLKLCGGAVGPWLALLWSRVAPHMIKQIEMTFEKLGPLLDSQGELPRPLLQGEDLIHRGLKPGPQFGKILESSYDRQLTLGADRKALLKWLDSIS